MRTRSAGLLLCVLVVVTESKVPAQWFYSEDNIASRTQPAGGCTFTRWNGTDPNGVAGYPWVATVNCPPGHSFQAAGVNELGMLRFYLRSGSMQLNGEHISGQGSSYWASQGVALSVNVSGSVYVVGAEFALSSTVQPAVFTSSFGSVSTRAYTVQDALAGRNNASNVHDIHVNNGTTDPVSQSAHDLMWSSQSRVDPPSIVVLNCAPGVSHVLAHSHPAGALYIPFTGRICFDTTDKECTSAGYARWTSPNLYYYETFEKVFEQNEATAEADSLVAAAGIKDCSAPVVFAVTNFDPDIGFGQPNFVDVPANVQSGYKQRQWGTFQNIAVRTTTVLTETVELES
eukprot:TRINITY_DN9831_c0_g1_i2.p1 TRINITY_DN9831_c0_g1~~TRINITY_DN9831_c0_g1_i2.p1  ORF type:complete len:344 (+),score=54.90 TRINITY_DN9831_c0_g1_i2:79-1110(+)